MTTNKDFRVKNGLVVEQDANIGGNLVVTGTITGDGSGLSGVTSYTATDFANDLATKTTTDLAEGTNLYYTTTRFDDRLATKTTDNLTEGSTRLYYTTARANSDFDSRLALKSTSDLTEGTNLYFTNARARESISVTDSGGDGSLSYNNSTGVITYTGPSASEVRAHFSAGTGVTLTNGQIAIGQAVATSSNVTFADINATGNVQIDGNLTVSGTTVTVNATNLAVEDNMIYLNSGSAVSNPDLGIAGNYNDGTYRHGGFFRDATDGYWKVFKNYTLEPDASAFIDTSHASFALADIQAANFRGALVGNADTATTLQTSRNINGISFNGSADITITSNTTNALTIGTGLSGTSFNGSSAVTAAVVYGTTAGTACQGNDSRLSDSRQATNTNTQLASLGVGTAASGTAGEIRATNNITAYFSSDSKFKENIRDIQDPLSIVCEIGSKQFEWTDEYIAEHGGEDGYFIQKSDFGVVAQDVLRVFPQAVRTRPDGYLAVDYEKLATLSFGAINQLLKRIQILENK